MSHWGVPKLSHLIWSGAATVGCTVSVIVIVVVVVNRQEAPTKPKPDYCDLKSCRGKPHTMCVYLSTNISKDCGECDVTGLKQEEKDKIVKIHNDFRCSSGSAIHKRKRSHKPPDLPEFKWSDELEMIAQRWANQCPKKRDQCRNTHRMECGQTIDYKTEEKTEDIQPLKMIEDWYQCLRDEEEAEYIVKKIYESNRAETEERAYFRLTETYAKFIGCGYIKCLLDKNYTGYFVCNYGPVMSSVREDKILYNCSKTM